MQPGLIRRRALLVRLLLALTSASATTNMVEHFDDSITDDGVLHCFQCTLDDYGNNCMKQPDVNATSGNDMSAFKTEACVGRGSRCQVGAIPNR